MERRSKMINYSPAEGTKTRMRVIMLSGKDVMARNKARTEEQKFADSFDCDLYRLIDRAETYARKNIRLSPHWLEVSARLRDARILVRYKMHEDDLKGTEG